MQKEKWLLIASLLLLAFVLVAVVITQARRVAGGRGTDAETMELLTSHKELAGALKDPARREEALRSLQQNPNVEAVDMLAALSHKNEDPEVRAACLTALGSIGDAKGLHALTIGARDIIPEVRIAAVRALGKLGDATAQSAIADSLEDTELSVRKAAALTLSTIPEGAPAATPALLKVFEEEQDHAEIRRLAAVALGTHKDDDARRGLLAVLAGQTNFVRAAALDGLLAHDDSYRVTAIVCAMADPDPSVKDTAMAAAAQLDADSLGPLTKALHSSDFGAALHRCHGTPLLIDTTALLERLAVPETFDGLTRLLEIAAGYGSQDAIDRIAPAVAKLGPDFAEPLGRKALTATATLQLKSAVAKALSGMGKPAIPVIRDYVASYVILPSSEEAGMLADTLEKIGGAQAKKVAEQARAKDPQEVLARVVREAAASLASTQRPSPPPAGKGLTAEYYVVMKQALYGGNPASAYVKRRNNMPWLEKAADEPEVEKYVPSHRTDLRLDLRVDNGVWKRVYAHGINRGRHFAKVVKATVSDDALNLSIRLGMADDPWLVGGYGEYDLTLKAAENGSYKGKYKGFYHNLEIAGEAVGEKKPDRPPVPAGFRPVQPNEHPRILFRTYELPRLRASLGTPFGKAAFRRMASSRDPVCLGMVYQLVGDPKYAEAAIPLVRAEMAKRDFGFMSLGQIWGPRLTTIALAYDLCWNAWTPEFRKEVDAYLVRVSNLTSTEMGRFSVSANWASDSNYASPIQGGGAMLSLAFWMDPGRPTPPPAGNRVTPLTPLPRVPAGVPVVPLVNKQAPQQWLWTGPLFVPADPGEFIDAIAGAACVTNGTPLKAAGARCNLKPVPPEYMGTDGINPWVQFAELNPGFSAVAFLMHTVVDNNRPGYYRVELPPQGDSIVTVAGKEMLNRDIIKLDSGLYPVYLAHATDSNAVASARLRFTYLTDSDNEIKTLIEESKERLQLAGLWHELNEEEHKETGMNLRKIQVFHQCRHCMLRNARQLMGDGGYQSEGEKYTHTADTPVRYHTAHKRMFGEMVSPRPNATHFPLRYMVAAIMQEQRERPPTLFMQPFNAGKGIGFGVQFMMLGFPVIPDRYKPGVLWIWDRISGVDPARPETRTNIVANIGLGDLPWVFVNYPFDPATGGTSIKPEHPDTNFPRTYQAMGKGMYLFRNRWQDKDDLVFQIYARHETGGGWSQQNAAALRLYGFGREWARTVTGRGAERWLDSIVLLPDNAHNPGAVGRTISWAADEKNGSGHVSVDLNKVYAPPSAGMKRALNRRRELLAKGMGVDVSEIPRKLEDPKLRGMRAVAVDYSGKCGAPGLFVVVDKIESGAQRQWLWHLPAERDLKTEVLRDGRSFLASQNGATLKGTFIAPAEVKILAVANVKEHLEMPELARSAAEQSPGFVANAPAGTSYFAVLTLQRGTAPPKVVVESGSGLDSVVRVGDMRIRFDGKRVVLAAAGK